MVKFACNIDRKGRWLRGASGVVVLITAALLAALWAARGGGGWAWVAVGLLAIFGSFQIFEARKGWCAVRALGYKTPI